MRILFNEVLVVDVRAVEDAHPLRRRHAGQLTKLVEVRRIANRLVFLAILAEGHLSHRRLERDPINEHAIEFIVLDRQRLDRQGVQGDQALQADRVAGAIKTR